MRPLTARALTLSADVIKKRLDLAPDQALFLHCGSLLPASSETMRELYARHDVDGFLYLAYSGESAFG